MNIPEHLSRAISIRQPHVELILREEKLHEYRSWHTNIRERVFLYAAKTLTDAYGSVADNELMDLPRGLIVGSVDIVACDWDSALQSFAFGVERPRRYDKPFKPLGQPQPGFWRPRFS